MVSYWLYLATVFWAIILPSFGHLQVFGGSITMVDILVLMSLIAYIICFRGKFKLFRTKIFIFIAPFLLLTLFLAFAGAFGHDIPTIIKGAAPNVRTVLYSTMFLLTISHSFKIPNLIKHVGLILLIGIIIQVGYSILEFSAIFFGYPSFSSLPYIPTRVTTAGDVSVISYAAAGLYNIPFTLGWFSGIMAIIYWTALFYEHGLAWTNNKAIIYILFLLSIVGVLISLRRTSLLATIFALLVVTLFILMSRKQKKPIIFRLSTFLILSIIVFSFLLINVPAFKRFASLAHFFQGEWSEPSLQNLRGRIDVTWANQISIFLEHPFGVGLFPPNVFKLGSDSIFLTFLAQGGLPYVMSYLFFLGGIFIYAYKARKKAYNPNNGIPFVVIGVITLVLISGLATGGAWSLPHYILLWVLFGCLVIFIGQKCID